MSKVFAIFFLSTYLVSTTQLSQLLKLPVLVEHYNEHHAMNPGLSFTDFLTIHYRYHHFEGHPYDKDFEQDQKLPFIMHTNALSVVFAFHQLPAFHIENKAPVNENSKIPPVDDPFLHNTFLSTIWQPPRSC